MRRILAAAIGLLGGALSQERFSAFIGGERRKWPEVVTAAGVKIG